MSRLARSGRALLTSALAIVVLASCAAPTLPAPPRSELVIGIVGDVSPVLDDRRPSAAAALVIEPLVRRSATEELEPRLVEDVPRLEDGTAFVDEEDRIVATFRIRDGAEWHDGTPVTSSDVLFALEEDRAAPEATERWLIAERIERIEAIDERTIRVLYRAHERWDLFATAPRALPRHILESPGGREAYSRAPVHAGPYRIEHAMAQEMILAAFSGHVLDRPQVERIVVRSYADRTALLAALGRGLVDVAPSPALEADLVRTLDRSADGASSQVIYTPAQAVAALRLGPLFAEAALGDAVRQALDRSRISQSIFAGRVRLTSSYLVPPLWAAAELGEPAAPDREAARASLARAGFRPGPFGAATSDGVPLQGTILVPRGAPALEDTARSIAADLSALGIGIGLSEVAPDELARRVASGDFDLALEVQWNDDPLLATERYRASEWKSVLADAARTAAGRAEQRLLYEELQRSWAEDAPAIALYQVLKVDVVPARLRGVRPAAHGAPVTWNAGQWSLGPS